MAAAVAVSSGASRACAATDQAAAPARRPAFRSLVVEGDRGLEALTAVLDETLRRNNSAVVLVSGTPAAGARPLAAGLAGLGETHGAQVLRGRCSGHDASPFRPWIQILRSYAETLGREDLLADLGSGASSLAEICPEIVTGISRQQPRPIDEAARFRIFDSFGLFLERAAARQPLVVILEDLQLADTASLLQLLFIARHHGGRHRLLVVAFQHEGGGSRRSPEIAGCFAQIHREVVRLHLLQSSQRSGMLGDGT